MIDLRVPLLKAGLLPDTPHSASPFDVSGITDTILRALASAGLDTQSGPLKGVTDTIHQALSGAGLNQRTAAPSQRGVTIDGFAREIAFPDDGTDHAPFKPTAPARRADPSDHDTSGVELLLDFTALAAVPAE